TMPAYLNHQQKVLWRYKRDLFRDQYRFFACLLRAHFDEKRYGESNQAVDAGEEEFWDRQHPQPYIFPDSTGSTSYERYDCYKVPEWALDLLPPSEKAMYPDYFKVIQQIQEESPVDGPWTEALSPAHKKGTCLLYGGIM
uniref:NADH dehydrogenase [ubiquinone] 1 beta subcomplex subunit 9 n=1 Tax=Anolis carolinensis TaxID=28377 RepID=A0A803TFW1_ANOCA